MKPEVHVPIQPDDESCGITCLKAIYDLYSRPASLDILRHEIDHWPTGGTVAVNLARHALDRGFEAEIYAYNPRIFDPTWSALPPAALAAKLRLRKARTRDRKRNRIIGFYLDYLRKGGRLRFDDLDESLMRRLAARRAPVVAGVSATYLYRQPRETHDNRSDDVRGEPVAHFVVVAGWNARSRTVAVRDPLRNNPIASDGRYRLPFRRFANAVMLAALTDDEALLILSEAKKGK